MKYALYRVRVEIDGEPSAEGDSEAVGVMLTGEADRDGGVVHDVMKGVWYADGSWWETRMQAVTALEAKVNGGGA